MIITIDGPTASGKSTIAQLLAEQLDATHINSGMLFRGLAYILIQRAHNLIASGAIKKDGILDESTKTQSFFRKIVEEYPELLDAASLEKVLQEEQFNYRFVNGEGPQIFIREQQITSLLKTPEIDAAASVIATHAGVRQVLLDFQRNLATQTSVVADGRDCGTVVFPHADYKFFLTASLEVRASRWCRALEKRIAATQPEQAKPMVVQLTPENCKHIVEERDKRDSTRELAPLKPASDAYIIDSSKMTVQEVLSEIGAILKKQL